MENEKDAITPSKMHIVIVSSPERKQKERHEEKGEKKKEICHRDRKYRIIVNLLLVSQSQTLCGRGDEYRRKDDVCRFHHS